MMRWAQVGTKHGHAAGKLRALRAHSAIELAGVYEADAVRRAELQQAGAAPYDGVHWYDDLQQVLADRSIVAVASEGANNESLAQTAALVEAGKQVWYDKPAGCDWPRWQQVVASAERQQLVLQMGYMLRYHAAFRQIDRWHRDGLLGTLTSVRGHMSTTVAAGDRAKFAEFAGGIFFDLGGHLLDQVVWLLGRPHTVSSFLRSDGGGDGVMDNALVVCETESAIAFVDISCLEAPPAARRFEVYGTGGSAIVLEPFEPGSRVRLCLREAAGGFAAGEQIVTVDGCPRQELYSRELEALLATLAGKQPPDRSAEHELLVQETLLRATGDLTT